MSNLPRMRTRDKAIALLRQEDPETALTRFALDRLIASGKVPHVRIGNKVLINYDLLLEIVATGIDKDEDIQEQRVGIIRKIEV